MFAVVTLLATSGAPYDLRAENGPAVERYLARLGLDDLRLRHLERTLAQTRERKQRTALATQLATAYVERLLATGDDPAAFDELQQRLRPLLAAAPEVNTPEIGLLLLQAEYQQVEAQMLRWLSHTGVPPALDDLVPRLTHLATQFAAQQKSLVAEAEKITQALDAAPDRPTPPAIERQLAQKQALASRAQFFAGWSNYYLGVARSNAGTSPAAFTAAKTAFSDLLGVVDAKDYADTPAESLALESVWRSRAVIGLGLAEIGLDRLPAAERCFEWLRHASVPVALQDQGPIWHLQGLLNADKTEAALQLAEQQLATFAPGQSVGRTSFCVLLVRTGFGDKDAAATDRRLGELGIVGLAKLRQFDALSSLASKHVLSADSPLAAFYLHWLQARRQFTEAEKTKSNEGYAGASQLFTAALALPEAQRDLSVAGRCRLGLSWCQYRMGELEQAAKTFNEATPLLRGEMPADALQSAWMAGVSLYQLAATNKQFVPAAVESLEAVSRDFPQASQAARAQTLIDKLRPDLATPQERLRRLQGIPATDGRYADAQFDLCELLHDRWRQHRPQDTRKRQLAEQTAAAARSFIAATAEGEHERKVRASLLALETILQTEPPIEREAEFFLAAASGSASQLPAGHASLAEVRYRQLQSAQRRGDALGIAEHARWIATNASNTPYELTALMIVAQQADQAVEEARKSKAPASELAQRLATAEQAYQRLVQLLGASPTQIVESKNALAANSRLAYYLEQQSKWAEACVPLERLVEALPTDRKYLRRAAVAQFRSGKFDPALEHWRTLLSGLPGGSDAWLEAKHYQLECLRETDPATAQQVWRQFRLLYPEVKSPAWRAKFAALAEHFNS